MLKVGIVWVMAAVCAAPALAADAVPNDFVLFARYYPGYSTWLPWTLTIRADGSAVQETFIFEGDAMKTLSTRLTMTRDQLARLVSALGDADFFSLQPNYSSAITDNDAVLVATTMLGRNHEVRVYAPMHATPHTEVGRLIKVWHEILEQVPPPNPGQRRPPRSGSTP